MTSKLSICNKITDTCTPQKRPVQCEMMQFAAEWQKSVNIQKGNLVYFLPPPLRFLGDALGLFSGRGNRERGNKG